MTMKTAGRIWRTAGALAMALMLVLGMDAGRERVAAAEESGRFAIRSLCWEQMVQASDGRVALELTVVITAYDGPVFGALLANFSQGEKGDMPEQARYIYLAAGESLSFTSWFKGIVLGDRFLFAVATHSHTSSNDGEWFARRDFATAAHVPAC